MSTYMERASIGKEEEEEWKGGRLAEKQKEGHGYVEGLTMLWAYREVEIHTELKNRAETIKKKS